MEVFLRAFRFAPQHTANPQKFSHHSTWLFTRSAETSRSITPAEKRSPVRCHELNLDGRDLTAPARGGRPGDRRYLEKREEIARHAQALDNLQR